MSSDLALQLYIASMTVLYSPLSAPTRMAPKAYDRLYYPKISPTSTSTNTTWSSENFDEMPGLM